MIREIIIPTQNSYLLHLPDNLIGKKVEVIAFSAEDVSNEQVAPSNSKKRTVSDAVLFFKKNGVDFSKVEKWNREDLYE